MAFSFGFYNSISHDRMYDATQFMNLFDGILIDGVFLSVGDHFAVTPRSGMTITVGTGRAWFNGTWNFNDTKMICTIPESELIYKRIDAVVLEINKNNTTTGRKNRIFVKKGTPSNNPAKPIMTKSGNIYQYPLAYITVNPEVTEITGVDIQNWVGHAETPYCTGLIEVYNVDAIWSQWEARFNEWFDKLRESMSGDVASNLLAMIQRLENRVGVLENYGVIRTGYTEPSTSLGKDGDFYYKMPKV